MAIESDLNLGKFLQIAFSDGVRNQISEDYRDWESVQRYRVGDANARQLNFLFQTALGAAAIQYRGPGTSSFPTGDQITTAEHTARYKEIDSTVFLEYNLWNRARKSPDKYAEPLALEIGSKVTAAKRRLSADLYGDGSGRVGTVASITESGGGGAQEVVVTLDVSDTAVGHVGFFEFGDILVSRQAAGAQRASTGGEALGRWRVTSKDRANDQVTLTAQTAANATDTGVSASNLAAGDYFLRYEQPTLDADFTNVTDWGTVTEVMAGLESLVHNDGRVIHGITMSGASGGSRYSAGGDPLDVKHIQAAQDQTKVNVGQGTMSWKMMCMAPEAQASLIESRETDRRFNSVEDKERGVKYFAYQHGNDSMEAYTSEYCPKSRIYIKPETKSGGKVMEFYGSDFEAVKMGGMGEFHLRPSASGGGHDRTVITYLEALCVLICKQPAAVTTIHDFEIL